MIFQFWLIYGQLASLQFRHTRQLLRQEMSFLLTMPPAHLEYTIRERSTDDLRIAIDEAGLFTADHEPVTGELQEWPEGLTADGQLHDSVMVPEEGAPYQVWFLARPVSDGRVLVLGRSMHMLGVQKLLLRRAFLTTILPVLGLALMTGLWLSHRALRRVRDMHEAVDRIMRGDIHERLPAGTGRDDLERLAGSVNRMLDRLEQLMADMQSVGNDIAHDLRTPLARVRARLERVLSGGEADNAVVLRESVGWAIENLDQCFAIITAILRIGEIDNGRRRDGFAEVDLVQLVGDIIDLYEPIAESEGVTLSAVRAEHVPSVPVPGDRDLLIEMLANLVDNAIKFTPSGGSVRVEAGYRSGVPVVSVSDTGGGIAPEERAAVLTRFYRSDKSRHIRGSGLGLSLVASVMRFHNGRIVIEDADCSGSVSCGGAPVRGACLVAVFPDPSGDAA